MNREQKFELIKAIIGVILGVFIVFVSVSALYLADKNPKKPYVTTCVKVRLTQTWTYGWHAYDKYGKHYYIHRQPFDYKTTVGDSILHCR